MGASAKYSRAEKLAQKAATGDNFSASTVRREACKSHNCEFHIQNTTDQMSQGYLVFMRDNTF